MPRDADGTRRRILAAAAAQFAAHGFAGARIERIASEAVCNKQLIYAHFGSKDSLYDAVFDAMVVQTVRDVPMDIGDLPEYAARLFDQHLAHPEAVRIQRWDELERGGRALSSDTVAAAARTKARAIAAAQDLGTISAALPAAEVVDLLVALSRTGADGRITPGSRQAGQQRAAIKEAVARLLAP